MKPSSKCKELRTTCLGQRRWEECGIILQSYSDAENKCAPAQCSHSHSKLNLEGEKNKKGVFFGLGDGGVVLFIYLSAFFQSPLTFTPKKMFWSLSLVFISASREAPCLLQSNLLKRSLLSPSTHHRSVGKKNLFWLYNCASSNLPCYASVHVLYCEQLKLVPWHSMQNNHPCKVRETFRITYCNLR